MQSLGKFLFLLLLLVSSAWGAEGDLYNFSWLDPEKKVYVLQNKIYPKKNSVYFNVGGLLGLGSNSSYQNIYGAHFSMGYYPFEEWAIEFFYHYYKNSNNENKKVVESEGVVPFIRRFYNKTGGMLLWSPFYGKINIFNKIIYFDWSLGLGGGKIAGESNVETAGIDFKTKENYEFVDESFSGIFFKTSLRIYFFKHFHAGIEYHWDTYQGKKPLQANEELRFNHEAILLLGVSF